MKRFVLFALMMLFTGAANSQVLKEYFDESFVLDDNLPDDTSYHYKASDHTLMKTGFLYSPRTDNFGRFDIGEGQPQPVNPCAVVQPDWLLVRNAGGFNRDFVIAPI